MALPSPRDIARACERKLVRFCEKGEEESLLALLPRSPGFENCLCGGKNPCRALIGNFFLALQPVLNVAACGFCAGQPERLATDERDGFSLYFPDVPVNMFQIHKLLRSRVDENNMSYFMQRGFERELRNWVNGYLALMRETLHVAVDFIEWGARDVERLQGGVQVKAGDCRLAVCFPLGLRQDKPIVTENEALPHLVVRLFRTICWCIGRHALFVGHSHTQT